MFHTLQFSQYLDKITCFYIKKLLAIITTLLPTVRLYDKKVIIIPIVKKKINNTNIRYNFIIINKTFTNISVVSEKIYE